MNGRGAPGSHMEGSATRASSHFTAIELVKPLHFAAAAGAGLLAPVSQYVAETTNGSPSRLIQAIGPGIDWCRGSARYSLSGFSSQEKERMSQR